MKLSGLLLGLVVFLACYYYIEGSSNVNINFHFADILRGAPSADSECEVCSSEHHVEACLATPFDPLTVAEMTLVQDYLRSEFNLVVHPTDHLAVNYIWLIELLLPPKAEVLNHLDNGGPMPTRKAKATLFMGEGANPEILEVAVPLANPSAYEIISHLPFMMRTVDNYELDMFEPLVEAALETLKPLTVASYGLTYVDCEDDCLYWTEGGPKGYQRTTRESWIWLMRDTDGRYLESLGLSFQMHHESRDPSDWYIDNFVYMAQGPYPTAQALLDAYNNGDITIYTVDEQLLAADEVRFSTMRERGTSHAFADIPGSSMYTPGGQRFSLNGNKLSYMGWSAILGYSPQSGPIIYDLKYDDERIAYELAINEAYAGYSGFGPIGSNTIYADSGWGFGTALSPLALGVDCPANALLLDIPYYFSGDSEGPPQPDYLYSSVCIFELDTSVPVMRHFEAPAGGKSFYSGFKGHKLVVRFPTSVWNYDYMVDFQFDLDGSLEVVGAASGYLQAGNALEESQVNPNDPTDDGHLYGRKISPYTWGQLHDHLLSVKIDFDIINTQNSFENVHFKTRQVNRPWLSEATTFKYAESVIEPVEVGLKQDLARPSSWRIVNENLLNKWGYPRGYRLSFTSTHQLLPDDHPHMKASAWSKYSFAVTQRKESEPTSAHIFDVQAPADPLVNFDNFLDGESIVNQDLVAWLTFGTMHLPSAEDIPNTVSSMPYSRFSLRPDNFFDESPSVRVRENVYVDMSAGKFDRYALEQPQCTPEEYKLSYGGVSA